LARVRSARRQDGAGRGAGAVGTAGYSTHMRLHVCTEPWPAPELLTRGVAGAPASARRRPPGCASRGPWPQTPRSWRRQARTRARGTCSTATPTPADPGRATETYVGVQHTSMHAQATGQVLARRGRASPGWVVGAPRPRPRWHARTAAHRSAPLLALARARAPPGPPHGPPVPQSRMWSTMHCSSSAPPSRSAPAHARGTGGHLRGPDAALLIHSDLLRLPARRRVPQQQRHLGARAALVAGRSRRRSRASRYADGT